MLFVLIVFCFFSASALQDKNPFAPAPNGAIAMKIGKFQNFYNIFFWESHYYNTLKVNSLH